MSNIKIMEIIQSKWVITAVLLVLWLVVFLLFKSVLFHQLKKLAAKTANKLDDFVLDALKKPIIILFGGAGLWILGSNILPSSTDKTLLAVFQISVAAAVFFFLDSILKKIFKEHGDKIGLLKGAGEIIGGLIRGLIFALIALIVLDSMGVSITPLLASLGIGSLAVALALQDTLANFFSGLQILIDKPVEPGQFVRLDNGQEGYIEKIGWRSTWIRMLPNNEIIIPNKKLIDSIIVNYYKPSAELAVLVDVGVHYASDLKFVEKVTCEVGKIIMETVPGADKTFVPFIRYNSFGESSVNFTVILRAIEFTDSFLVKHEFIKALHERYKKENIVIPYPIRTLEIDKKYLSAAVK